MSDYKKVNFEIIEEYVGQRLDKVLGFCDEVSSRSQAMKLIKDGLVCLKDKKMKASKTVSLGEVYELSIPVEVDMGLLPYEYDLEIIYQDDDVIVINKPAGIVMHPSAGHANDSIVNALIYMKVELSMGFNEKRPGIVHRLDKDTSGLVVIAKNTESHQHLADQFRERTVNRRYWAIVYGQFKEEQGAKESYLMRHPVNRKKYVSEKEFEDREPTGKFARTNYRILKTYKNEFSLVECKLDTGRTHQIRIHMSEDQHPIIGDQLYGTTSMLKRIESGRLRAKVARIGRLGLHAHTLGFIQPKTGKELLFTCPWPEDIKEIVEDIDFEKPL